MLGQDVAAMQPASAFAAHFFVLLHHVHPASLHGSQYL
jgi:recombinational DNA repair protein RecR